MADMNGKRSEAELSAILCRARTGGLARGGPVVRTRSPKPEGRSTVAMEDLMPDEEEDVD